MTLMTMPRALAAAAALALAACNPATLAAVGAAGATAATIAGTVENGAVVFTAAAKMACAGQAGANAIGAIAASSGDAKAAQKASDVSTVLGAGCTWSNPT